MFVKGDVSYNEYANVPAFDLCRQTVTSLLAAAYKRGGVAIKDVTWVGPFNDLFQDAHVCANIVYRDRYQTLDLDDCD